MDIGGYKNINWSTLTSFQRLCIQSLTIIL